MTIFNYYQVTDKIASSGQPTESEFYDISEKKYAVIINLAMPDHTKSIANEGSIVTSLGMRYIHIPVPFDSPSENDFLIFSKFMDSLKEENVWIHCIVNARVSAFLFRYLQVSRGFSADEARTPILKKWLPKMDDVWKKFISKGSGF